MRARRLTKCLACASTCEKEAICRDIRAVTPVPLIALIASLGRQRRAMFAKLLIEIFVKRKEEKTSNVFAHLEAYEAKQKGESPHANALALDSPIQKYAVCRKGIPEESRTRKLKLQRHGALSAFGWIRRRWHIRQ